METTFTINKSRNPLCLKFHRRLPNVKSLRILIKTGFRFVVETIIGNAMRCHSEICLDFSAS